MARKKSSTPGDPNPPGMTDAAGMLATYAAGVLAQPESRSHAASLKLGRSERAVIAGVPGLDKELKGRLDIPSTGVKSFRFTLDELARICLAVSEALLDVEGRDAVKRLAVAGKITDVLDQAVGELESPSKVKRVARRPSTKARGIETRTKAKVGRAEADSAREARSPLVGYWRITWMEQWAQDFVDAEVEGFVRFDEDGSGEFHFGYVHGHLSYQETERNERPAVVFTFEGNDEMDPCSGRGWAVRKGERIGGKIVFHGGDESKFKAETTSG